jgi:hypothetical protein
MTKNEKIPPPLQKKKYLYITRRKIIRFRLILDKSGLEGWGFIQRVLFYNTGADEMKCTLKPLLIEFDKRKEQSRRPRKKNKHR